MEVLNGISVIANYPRIIKKGIDELRWASIWHDTIREVKWANGVSVSPGRYAVGYNFLYALTRILSEKRPQKVLDIGLGISSTFISSYFIANDVINGIHTIVEGDKNWMDFYLANRSMSKNSKVLLCSTITVEEGGKVGLFMKI